MCKQANKAHGHTYIYTFVKSSITKYSVMRKKISQSKFLKITSNSMSITKEYKHTDI